MSRHDFVCVLWSFVPDRAHQRCFLCQWTPETADVHPGRRTPSCSELSRRHPAVPALGGPQAVSQSSQGSAAEAGLLGPVGCRWSAFSSQDWINPAGPVLCGVVPTHTASAKVTGTAVATSAFMSVKDTLAEFADWNSLPVGSVCHLEALRSAQWPRKENSASAWSSLFPVPHVHLGEESQVHPSTPTRPWLPLCRGFLGRALQQTDLGQTCACRQCSGHCPGGFARTTAAALWTP